MPNEFEPNAEEIRIIAWFGVTWFVVAFTTFLLWIRAARNGENPLASLAGSHLPRPRPWGALVLAGLFVIIAGDVGTAIISRSGESVVVDPDELPPDERYAFYFDSIRLMLIGKAVVIAALCGMAYWQFRESGRRLVAWRGLSPRPADLLIALITILICQMPLLLSQGVLQKLFYGDDPVEHPYIKLLKSIAAEEQGVRLDQLFMLIAVSAVVVAPIIEEIFFRGLLQGWLRNVIPIDSPWPAIAGTSLAFSLAHYSHGPAPYPLFFFSLILGYLYESTGRLAPSVLTHALFNGVTAALLWLQITGRIALD